MCGLPCLMGRFALSGELAVALAEQSWGAATSAGRARGLSPSAHMRAFHGTDSRLLRALGCRRAPDGAGKGGCRVRPVRTQAGSNSYLFSHSPTSLVWSVARRGCGDQGGTSPSASADHVRSSTNPEQDSYIEQWFDWNRRGHGPGLRFHDFSWQAVPKVSAVLHQYPDTSPLRVPLAGTSKRVAPAGDVWTGEVYPKRP